MMPPSEQQQATPDTPARPVSFQCTECAKKLRVKTALAGKKIRCPKCGAPQRVPNLAPETPPPLPPAPSAKRPAILPVVFLVAALFGCAIWANLSFAVTNPVNYKYFPPFRAYVNSNWNNHLGAEYFNIAKAMVAGAGFANPFGEQTGPTAWMPPVLPTILAGLLWICDGNREIVMAVFIFLEVYVLIGTGLLVVILARQTTTVLGAWMAALIFFLAVIGDFHLWFQFTHDCWIVLLALDLLVVGFCWLQPLHSKKAAAAWGLCGGFFALINPIAGFIWGILTLALAYRTRAWLQLGLAVLCAGLAVGPWVARNYAIFGRFIPVKSNLVYELYQSQCLLEDGLLQPKAFGVHPYSSANAERQAYKTMGEMTFLDQKRELFWKAVHKDPLDFADRVASRFLGATLWYVPFNRGDERTRPWVTWWSRLTHPLPFLALMVLVFSSVWQRLHWYQTTVMAVYTLYLLPYIGVSYYERYAMPLLGVKVLLVIWGMDRLLALWRGRAFAVVIPSAAPEENA